MKHPLDLMVAPGPLHLHDRVVDVLSFAYPKRVHVVVRGTHPKLSADHVDAEGYYAIGPAARLRPRGEMEAVVYRLPWRMWRSRHLAASGDWRRVDDRMTLVGILLLSHRGFLPGRP